MPWINFRSSPVTFEHFRGGEGRTNIWQIEITFPIRRNGNYKENIYTAHIVTCSHAIRSKANGKQTIVTSSPFHTSQRSLRIANFTIKGYQKGFSSNRAKEIRTQIPQGGLLSWMLRLQEGNPQLRYFLSVRVFLKITLLSCSKLWTLSAVTLSNYRCVWLQAFHRFTYILLSRVVMLRTAVRKLGYPYNKNQQDVLFTVNLFQ